MALRGSIIFSFILLMLLLPACQPYDRSPALTGTAAATASPEKTSPVLTPAVSMVPSAATVPASDPVPTSTPFSVYAPTVNMSFEELVGDMGYDKLPEGFPSPDTYHVIVDIHYQVVIVYALGSDGDYTEPVRYMLCSTGDHTPVGTFDMMAYHVRFGKFNSLNMCGQYWSQIRNRIYFHSILYDKKDASTYDEESYSNLGRPGTPGCVYLTVPDARWIYYHIAPGSQIEIREGSADDKQTAEIRAGLTLAPLPKERVFLEKGVVLFTDNWTIEDVPIEVPFVQGSQK